MLEWLTWGLVGALLGTASDLRGVGATGLVARIAQRFDTVPSDARVFAMGLWSAASRATHGVVQQVYESTSHEEWPEKAAWDRFRHAHATLRKDRAWRDGRDQPPDLGSGFAGQLARSLRENADDPSAGQGAPEEAMWAFYRQELARVGFVDAAPPEIVRQAFFGDRPEEDVWSWSKHFALRIGERLRDDPGFKAMFDAVQTAMVGQGVQRLIVDAESAKSALNAMIDRMDELIERQERMEAKLDRALESRPGARDPDAVRNDEAAEFKRWFIQHAITTGGFARVDPWTGGDTREEVAFKRLLRGRDEQSFDLIRIGNHEGVVALWAPLEDDAFFRIDHDTWYDKPFFRCRIQTAKAHLFFAHVNLAPREGFEMHTRMAYALMSELLAANPYSMEGASHDRLSPEIAEVQNLNYRDTLEFAAEWISGWGGTAIRACCGVGPEERDRITERIQDRISQIDYLFRLRREA